MLCPNRKRITQAASTFYDENVERYEDERLEAFLEQLKADSEFSEETFEFISREAEGYTVDELTEDWFISQISPDLEDWIEFEAVLETFTFPSEGDWLAGEFESYIGDWEDRCYEEARDRRLEER